MTLVKCKMFPRKSLKLKWIHKSNPPVWKLNKKPLPNAPNKIITEIKQRFVCFTYWWVFGDGSLVRILVENRGVIVDIIDFDNNFWRFLNIQSVLIPCVNFYPQFTIFDLFPIDWVSQDNFSRIFINFEVVIFLKGEKNVFFLGHDEFSGRNGGPTGFVFFWSSPLTDTPTVKFPFCLNFLIKNHKQHF